MLRYTRKLTPPDRKQPTKVAFHPDPDSFLLASLSHKKVSLWDMDTMKCRTSFASGGINSEFAWSRDGGNLATCRDDGIVQIWDVAHGLNESGAFVVNAKEQVAINAYEKANRIESIAYGDNCRHFVTGSVDGVVKLWDSRCRSAVGSSESKEPAVITSIDFGRGLWTNVICTSWDDGLIRFYDVRRMNAAYRPLKMMKMLLEEITCSKKEKCNFYGCTFARLIPNGEGVVAGYSNGSVICYDKQFNVRRRYTYYTASPSCKTAASDSASKETSSSKTTASDPVSKETSSSNTAASSSASEDKPPSTTAASVSASEDKPPSTTAASVSASEDKPPSTTAASVSVSEDIPLCKTAAFGSPSEYSYSTVIVGTANGQIVSYDTREETNNKTAYFGHSGKGAIHSLDHHPRYNIIASSSVSDRSITLWDYGTGY